MTPYSISLDATQTLLEWLALVPMVKTLLWMIAFDVMTGLGVACVKRKLNSAVSFVGITKKVFMLLLVGMAYVLEPFANGLPLAKLVAFFYVCTEGISVLENAGALGLPLPRALVQVLQKLREDKQKKIEQKSHPSEVITTTTTKTETETKL